MAQQAETVAWARGNAARVRRAILKDLPLMLVAALLIGGATAFVSAAKPSATSSAQLVLTPIPLRENYDPERSNWNYSEDDSALARMFAFPLQAKSAALLCTSDETLLRTLDRLKADGALSSPLGSLNQLRGALKHTISIDIETPYEVAYSPILQLTATAATPSDAAILVNTWAEECVAAAQAFQRLRQAETKAAFQEQANRLKLRVEAFEGQTGSVEFDSARVAHKDVATKLEYVAFAGEYSQAPLQVLARGAEWDAASSGQGLLLGAVAGLWTLVLAGLLSIALRVVLIPLPES